MSAMDRPFRTDKTPYGNGLFATERIEVGKCLGRVPGRVLRMDQVTEEQTPYLIDFGDDKVLYPFSPFRNLNHSCSPNAELSYDEDKMYVDVIRTILPGQQITIDYGWHHQDAIPCECGSRNCRGWIVAADELHLLQKPTAAG
jgi:uncharacterized protein